MILSTYKSIFSIFKNASIFRNVQYLSEEKTDYMLFRNIDLNILNKRYSLLNTNCKIKTIDFCHDSRT